ncbi:unnamed protein product [Protopolystoma xenopodis]|uniref:Uncharacterized protein n=1 Tax=Protopolystoma xenopodis TaxID=117903 RepID=A0A448WQC3_9PLAT|nr:unnamed protein product [Protopolystoma xenopodis]
MRNPLASFYSLFPLGVWRPRCLCIHVDLTWLSGPLLGKLARRRIDVGNTNSRLDFIRCRRITEADEQCKHYMTLPLEGWLGWKEFITWSPRQPNEDCLEEE